MNREAKCKSEQKFQQMGNDDYADGNTLQLYTFGVNLAKIKNIDIVSHCFYESYMVLNAGKCHFMNLGTATKMKRFYSIIILWKIAMNKKFLDS